MANSWKFVLEMDGKPCLAKPTNFFNMELS